MSRRWKWGGAALLLGGVGLVFLTRGGPQRAAWTPRLLLVGWDGADWEVLDPMLAAGELPNLAALRARGSWGRLRSIEPILSPVVWTSIATGVTPEKHGITWFMADTDRPGRRIPVTSTLRQRKAFWNVLSEAGVSVGVVGWWATYPAEVVRGFLLSDFVGYHGFGVTGRQVRVDLGKTYPPDLASEVTEAIGDPARIGHEDIARFLRIPREEYEAVDRADSGRFAGSIRLFRTYLSTARGYSRTAMDLAGRFQPNVLAVYFELSDAASHLFARYRNPKIPRVSEEGCRLFGEAVAEVYREQDRLLGELLTTCGPETIVLLVSDHGFADGPERPEEGDDVEVGRAHLWHRIDGVLVASGPPFRSGYQVERASILDVFPTLLRALDMPVASDLDGQVLLECFQPSWVASHPPRRVATFEGHEAASKLSAPEGGEAFAEEIEGRLSALGYLGTGGRASPEVHLGRAGLLIRQGDFARAEAELEQALRMRPESAAARMTRAAVYVRTDRRHLARRECEKVLAAEPRHLVALCALADLEREDGNLEPARVLYETALDVKADSLLAHLGLGDVLNRLGRAAEAEEEFRRCLELDLTNADAHYNLGVLLGARGRDAEARQEYETALSFSPGHLPSILNLSDLLSRQGAADGAVRLLEEGARVAPRDPDVRYNLGTLLLERGEPHRAIESFQASLEVRPDFVFARSNLGIAFLRTGQADKARREFEIVTRLAPGDAEGWLQLARIEVAEGRRSDASEAVNRAIEAGGGRIGETVAADAVLRGLREGEAASRPASDR
ncbi:MAG TPA: tetratricopeptide repeat protein [Planctomycetota bacterium]|nr:tetratricopeptide repeat protein [Planctomycetota bacterium]